MVGRHLKIGHGGIARRQHPAPSTQHRFERAALKLIDTVDKSGMKTRNIDLEKNMG
jgi:hypothetical protein